MSRRNVCSRTSGEPYYFKLGRKGIPPGVYFRMLLVGYFEGIGSQRGIAWRCTDSLSLRKLRGAADQSTLTNIRERLPHVEMRVAMFQSVPTLASVKQLLNGKMLSVETTTLEANAAMKSIVRRETGKDSWEHLTQLERKADETPVCNDLKCFN